MQTRRAASMEEKLRATLKELESAKNLCDALLRERDDSELEVKNIIDKNTSLKIELSELHVSHTEILNEHCNLRQIVSEFQQCIGTHEQALDRISQLEFELSEAHKTITSLKVVKVQEQAATTCSLYNELVDSGSAFVSDRNTVTIDLTGDDSRAVYPIFNSHNKLKKYIKLNKTIRKYKKCQRFQNINKVNNSLRKKHLYLTSHLQDLNRELIQGRFKYDQDTALLQEQLESRENTLKDIFNKYQASQKDLSERMVEAGELVDLVRYNAERYESLTNNLCCTCSCSPPPANTQSVEPLLPVLPEPVLESNTLQSSNTCVVNKIGTYIYSDKLGQDFGSLISSFSQQCVLNTCLPGASLNKLTSHIASTELNSGSTSILLYGDGLAVSRTDIINCVDLMLRLSERYDCKFIFCALPYSSSLTHEENRHIYNLNMLIYNITHLHNSSILYFETNKFISRFRLTQYNMYISSMNKRRIAKLLAYNLQDTGTYAVPKVFDNVSNSTNSLCTNLQDKDTNFVSYDFDNVSNSTNSLYTSCNLNYKIGQREGCMN